MPGCKRRERTHTNRRHVASPPFNLRAVGRRLDRRHRITGVKEIKGEAQGVGDPPGTSRNESVDSFPFVVFPTAPCLSTELDLSHASPSALASSFSARLSYSPNRNEQQQCCLPARRQLAGRQQRWPSWGFCDMRMLRQSSSKMLLLAFVSHPPPPFHANSASRLVHRASTPTAACFSRRRSSDDEQTWRVRPVFEEQQTCAAAICAGGACERAGTSHQHDSVVVLLAGVLELHRRKEKTGRTAQFVSSFQPPYDDAAATPSRPSFPVAQAPPIHPILPTPSTPLHPHDVRLISVTNEFEDPRDGYLRDRDDSGGWLL
ncbi:hypothetical protein GALMADRAFT_259374 [Galerina marginata CBS 339.88]|uniref:Uncharacterized protein n=1 Tax=Galerina marginata (strain CBS 339.88) TaxID=685588 RepID=A0A067SHS8_GALM3|nr:hypothetical protein GALMADRAFT_259374 [Galerina marginata CBS 339.88]